MTIYVSLSKGCRRPIYINTYIYTHTSKQLLRYIYTSIKRNSKKKQHTVVFLSGFVLFWKLTRYQRSMPLYAVCSISRRGSSSPQPRLFADTETHSAESSVDGMAVVWLQATDNKHFPSLKYVFPLTGMLTLSMLYKNI